MADIGDLSERLGMAWGVSKGEPIVQYLAWSQRVNLFSTIAAHQPIGLTEIKRHTGLSDSGADALLRILTHVRLVVHSHGAYSLTRSAWEFLLDGCPYYIGDTLYAGHDKPLPPTYLARPPRHESDQPGSTATWSVTARLRVQHRRNLTPSVVAARTGLFDTATHVIDMGGGTGTFAIPLAQRVPHVRITLVDLPEVIPEVRPFLCEHDVADRIELRPLDMVKERWDLPVADTMFFGNVFHGATDSECAEFAAKAFDALPAGGQIWLHEVLLNENRDGPRLAVLWNANMAAIKEGARQRTAGELRALLADAGFTPGRTVSTAGRFSLLGATKRV